MKQQTLIKQEDKAMTYSDPEYQQEYDSWLTTEPEQTTEEREEAKAIYAEIFLEGE